MVKIRIGKDISIKWTILTNYEELSLQGRDLKLFITSPYNLKKEMDFTISGNIVHTRFLGIDQQHLGDYKLTLFENFGRINQSVVDFCDAFRLVTSTCEESCSSIDNEVLECTSNIIIGIKGDKGENGISGNINYPTFRIDDEMNLIMNVDAASDEDRFKLDDNGNLILIL